MGNFIKMKPYYVTKKENIGRGEFFSMYHPQSVAIRFDQKKKQVKDVVTNEYFDALLKTTVNPTSLEFYREDYIEEFLDNVTSEIASSLENELQGNKLASHMKLSKDLISDLKSCGKNDVNAAALKIEKYLNDVNRLVGATRNAQLFNLAAGGTRTPASLSAEVQTWLSQNNGRTINVSAMREVLKAWQTPLKNLTAGHSNSYKDLDGLIASIQKNALPQISEMFSALAQRKLYRQLNISLEENIPGAKLTGPIKRSVKEGVKTFKADFIKTRNHSLSAIVNNSAVTVVLEQRGASVKTYIGGNASYGRMPSSVNLGSTYVNLDSVLQEVLGLGSLGRYTILNDIAFEKDTVDLRAMNDYLVKRYLFKALVSSGLDKDFSNVIIINGKVINTWDIIKQSFNSDFSYSTSRAGGTSQFASVTIKNRKEFIKAVTTKRKNALERIIEASAEQEKMIIYIEFHTSKFMNLINGGGGSLAAKP